MCNAYKHPPGCQCGFGPPYPDVNARILKLVRWKDRGSSTVAELGVRFCIPRAEHFNLIGKDGKERVLSKTVQELQLLADNRFGKGNIEVIPTYVEKGSIEVGVVLLVVGGAVYTFFKDYGSLKKNVKEFITVIP